MYKRIAELEKQLEAERTKVAELTQSKKDAESVANFWRVSFQKLHAAI
jgi:hypothetical protein